MEIADTAETNKASESYLLNVVESLKDRILPELNGAASDRLNECITIITRVAHQLRLDDSTTQNPVAEPVAQSDWKTVADRDGEWLDAAALGYDAIRNDLKSQKPSADSRAFSREKLQYYLQAHALGQKDTVITGAKVLAGGRSKQTVLVEQEGAIGLPNELVIRRDWSSAITGTSVVTEFELLKRLAAAGLKVPSPYILESNADVLDTPFMVMQRIAGKPYGDVFHPLESEPLAFDLARQLAGMHRVPVEDFDALGVPTQAYTHAQLEEGLAGFRKIYETVGIKSPTIELALDWMEQAIPKVDGERALSHNDLGCHNFLIEGETLIAILDWEIANVGNPAADLGYVRSFVKKMTSWERFMAEYKQAGGPEISPHTIDFYALWSGVRLYCLLLRARAGVSMGMVHDTEITYACADFIPQEQHLISRELRQILGSAGKAG